MMETMRGVTLWASWAPRSGFVPGEKDIVGKQSWLGSRVWKHPRHAIEEHEIPTPVPGLVVVARASGCWP